MAQPNTRKLQPVPGSVEVKKRTVLGFRYERGVYVGTSERGAFTPHGLIIWGPVDSASIRMATIGMDEQVLQSMDGVPAKFFALGMSYEHLAQLMAEDIEPPAWVSWSEIVQGGSVRIMLTDESTGAVLGPEHGVRLAMWGENRSKIDPSPPAPTPAAQAPASE
jgi:hypothetical protein